MGVKVAKKYLQTDKYRYTWSRDKGDGECAGKLDRIKIDKDEGYEVLYFIQVFMNKHGMKKVTDVKKIENALHNPDLRSEVMRNKLISEIETMLGL